MHAYSRVRVRARTPCSIIKMLQKAHFIFPTEKYDNSLWRLLKAPHPGLRRFPFKVAGLESGRYRRLETTPAPPIPSRLAALPHPLFCSIVTGAHESSLDTEGGEEKRQRETRVRELGGTDRGRRIGRAHSGWMGALCLSKGLPATSQISRRDGSTSLCRVNTLKFTFPLL